MFARVVAWGFAAFLVVLPARLGIETDLLATAYMRAAVIATPSDRTDVSNQAADAATNKVEAKAESKAEDEIVPVAAESHAPEQNDGPSDMPPTALEKSATLDPAPPTVAPRSAAEPFGLVALPVSAGNVLAKWSTVEAAIRADDEILARCRDNADRCPPAAQNFLAIIAQGRAQTGRARVGVINRAINLAIQPMSDLAQWGVPDRWSAPLETFSTGRGDCEDYAIAKYVALTAAGVAALRSRYGVQQAVVSRYTIYSALLLIFAWYIIAEEFLEHRPVSLFKNDILLCAVLATIPYSLGMDFLGWLQLERRDHAIIKAMAAYQHPISPDTQTGPSPPLLDLKVASDPVTDDFNRRARIILADSIKLGIYHPPPL